LFVSARINNEAKHYLLYGYAFMNTCWHCVSTLTEVYSVNNY